MTPNHDALADLGAFGAILIWLIGVANLFLPIIQMVLGLVGIAAGLCAAIYHWKKIRE